MKTRIGIPRGGVIHEVLSTDHIVGSVGVGLKSYPKLLKTMDEGNQYYSKGELQATGGAGETNTCTNQSLMRIVQWFINYYYKNNLLAKKTVKFLEDNKYIVNGECNLSESFFAKVSKTNPRTGNSLTANCYAFNHYGCVPEALHPDDFTSDATFWREPTKEMIKLGKDFIEHFDINYAWLVTNATLYNSFTKTIYDSFKNHLLESRIYAAIPVCSPWDARVEYCGRKQSDHAIDICGRNGDDTDIKDSYIPFDKKLVNRYLINASMKVVIYPLIEKEIFNIKKASKEFLENSPLGVPNNMPQFGDWVKRTYKHILTKTDKNIYLDLRKVYNETHKIEITTTGDGWLKKIINYIKGLTLNIKSMNKIVKAYPILGSSKDSKKLALTIKGILVGITPLVLMIAGITNVDLGADMWSKVIEVIVDIVTYGGALVSSLMTLYGLLRKMYYRK